MNTCPNCSRKLLSHISIRCNWCGAEIKDPEYRAQAEVEHAALRAEDALHSLQLLTLCPPAEPYSRFDQICTVFGLPALQSQTDQAALVKRAEYAAWEQARREALLHAQQLKASQEQVAEGDSETEDRFGHLEL